MHVLAHTIHIYILLDRDKDSRETELIIVNKEKTFWFVWTTVPAAVYTLHSI